MKKIKFIALGILLVILLAAIPTNANNSIKSVKEAAEIAEKELLLKEGITGISYTDSEPYKIIIYIESEEYRSIVPSEIMSFKTDVRVSGRIVACSLLAEPQSVVIPQLLRKSRHTHWDPTVGGISVGTYYLTDSYGTLAVVTSGYILSCTHVIAQNTEGKHLWSGVSVIQPGLGDGGGPTIGYLYKYIKIRYGYLSYIFSNKADAAIATLSHSALSNQVLGPDDEHCYSVSMTAVVPNVGQTVRKSGAKTAVTQNIVIDNHATVKIRYTSSKWAIFKDQIIVQQPFVEGGDSGSFVDLNGKFVGLVFAGSKYYVGIVCKASYIKSALGI
ncbi:MAG: hypothetical protein ACQXXD_01060 [Thermoplasmatota archaeon]|jgi:hypothetical protein